MCVFGIIGGVLAGIVIGVVGSFIIAKRIASQS